MSADTTTLLLTLVPLLLAAGAFAGVLAGLLGVGGGIVIVPALYHIFGFLEIDNAVRMHLAVGTSLATIIPTSIRSVLSHRERGSFDANLFKAWTPGIVAGVIVGTWLATLSNFSTLTLIFAVVALLVRAVAGTEREHRCADPVAERGRSVPVDGCDRRVVSEVLHLGVERGE